MSKRISIGHWPLFSFVLALVVVTLLLTGKGFAAAEYFYGGPGQGATATPFSDDPNLSGEIDGFAFGTFAYIHETDAGAGTHAYDGDATDLGGLTLTLIPTVSDPVPWSSVNFYFDVTAVASVQPEDGQQLLPWYYPNIFSTGVWTQLVVSSPFDVYGPKINDMEPYQGANPSALSYQDSVTLGPDPGTSGTVSLSDISLGAGASVGGIPGTYEIAAALSGYVTLNTPLGEMTPAAAGYQPSYPGPTFPSIPIPGTPEPSSLVLFGLGIAGFAALSATPQDARTPCLRPAFWRRCGRRSFTPLYCPACERSKSPSRRRTPRINRWWWWRRRCRRGSWPIATHRWVGGRGSDRQASRWAVGSCCGGGRGTPGR